MKAAALACFFSLLLPPSTFAAVVPAPKQELKIELPDPRQPDAQAPAAPIVKAQSAILVDALNGQVLYEKNAHTRRPMASTTKIMTAVLVLENRGLDTDVVVSKKACEADNSSLHLKVGERLAVRDLLCGILIRSANDACVAAGETVAGTNVRFVRMMNERAKELGASDTHFVNAHGLHDPSHYSSAFDLALITRKAIAFAAFNEIVATRRAVIKRSKNKEDVVLYSQSKFLKRYPGADGVKSGYTKQAGRCYVGSATRDGWRLISVVLHSPNAADDTTALMDYGFNNFRPEQIAATNRWVTSARVRGGTAKTVSVVAGTQAHAVLRKWKREKVRADARVRRLSAPLRRGQRVGLLVASVDGRIVQTVPLRAGADVGRSLASVLLPWLRDAMILMVGLVVSKRYGAAAAKGPGRRRSRLAQEVRGADSRG